MAKTQRDPTSAGRADPGPRGDGGDGVIASNPSTEGMRAWVATPPVDMPKWRDGPAEVVRTSLGHDPLSAGLLVSRDRSAQRVKVLRCDRDWLAIYCKRLERGKSRIPGGGDEVMAIDSGQLPRPLSGTTAVATRTPGGGRFARFPRDSPGAIPGGSVPRVAWPVSPSRLTTRPRSSGCSPSARRGSSASRRSPPSGSKPGVRGWRPGRRPRSTPSSAGSTSPSRSGSIRGGCSGSASGSTRCRDVLAAVDRGPPRRDLGEEMLGRAEGDGGRPDHGVVPLQAHPGPDGGLSHGQAVKSQRQARAGAFSHAGLRRARAFPFLGSDHRPSGPSLPPSGGDAARIPVRSPAPRVPMPPDREIGWVIARPSPTSGSARPAGP